MTRTKVQRQLYILHSIYTGHGLALLEDIIHVFRKEVDDDEDDGDHKDVDDE